MLLKIIQKLKNKKSYALIYTLKMCSIKYILYYYFVISKILIKKIKNQKKIDYLLMVLEILVNKKFESLNLLYLKFEN